MYKDFREKLMKYLPMGDILFLEQLRKHNLLPGDLWEQVQAKSTKAEKVAWFLYNAIEPSLDIDKFEPLHRLLTVMSDNELRELGELAAEIKQKIDKGEGP